MYLIANMLVAIMLGMGIQENVLLWVAVALLVILILVIVKLVTDRKKQNEAYLEKIKEVTEEANRLKSSFIANMTHEVRTPLNAIMGFTTMLAEMDELDRETRLQFLHEINENKDTLLKIINDLLDYAKIDSDTLEYTDGDVDINALLNEQCMLRDAQRKAEGVHVEFVEKMPQCRLRIDRSRFAQVMDNLLHNALKFTAEGTVKVGYRKLANGNFYFYVADTGCGLDEEARRTIFDSFVKMNYNIKGTGLGLSIAKSIVEHYGGGIGVDSKKGAGATFYFTLPAKLEFHEHGKF